MVPFYGQGLNCGLEDVRVLDTLLREQDTISSSDEQRKIKNALDKYSQTRHQDLLAICDLAMQN